MIPGNPIPRAANVPPAESSPAPGQMQAAQGPGSLSDAHFRLDDHQRQIEELQKGMHPDHVAAIAHGAVSALHMTMQSQMDKMLKAQIEDIGTDKAVVAAIKELVVAIHALIASRKA